MRAFAAAAAADDDDLSEATLCHVCIWDSHLFAISSVRVCTDKNFFHIFGGGVVVIVASTGIHCVQCVSAVCFAIAATAAAITAPTAVVAAAAAALFISTSETVVCFVNWHLVTKNRSDWTAAIRIRSLHHWNSFAVAIAFHFQFESFFFLDQQEWVPQFHKPKKKSFKLFLLREWLFNRQNGTFFSVVRTEVNIMEFLSSKVNRYQDNNDNEEYARDDSGSWY